LIFGPTEEPYAQDWVVGPLPISEKTGYWPNTFGTQAKDAKIRVFDMDDSYDFLVENAMSMSDVLEDLLNGQFGCIAERKERGY
jgi:primary-amine oxidase